MNYQEWEAEVPETMRGDALWKMAVYRYSLFLCDLGWHDNYRSARTRAHIERRARNLYGPVITR